MTVPNTTQLVTEYEWQGPKRGADRAVLLAHGAGSDMNGAALQAVPTRSPTAKIPSLRFNYPYRTAGRKAPDRPKVLDAATREAAAELAKRTKLPPERLVLGGRSMGGRYCSMVVGDGDDPVPALGLLMLCYPLHAAGKPDQPRVGPLPGHPGADPVRVAAPATRWRAKAELTKAAKAVRGKVSFHWVDTADHGYRPLKASGRTADDVLAEVAATAVGLGGGAARLRPV